MEDHFSIFGTLYSVARPVFSDRLPTAAVSFNRAGNCVDFTINPTFWETLTMEQKLFVMSHEALHVFLNHGRRIKDVKGSAQMARCNLALDVVINHLLVDKFSYVRKLIDPKSVYCWRDTVFKKPVKAGQNYEYYLTRLKEQSGEGGDKGKPGEGEGDGKAGGSGDLLNDHSNLKSFGDDKSEEGKKALRDFLKRNVGTAQLEELASKLAGTESGEITKIIEEMKIVPKRKWETVIKQWSLRFAAENDVAQFILTNRRYALMPRSTTFLPTDSEQEAWDKNRVEVWFFMDTSGSCVGLADRFFKAALSLPKDRFKVRLFCFDTRCYDVDPVTRQLSGFGGTSFSCIETFIQQKIAFEGVSYPKQTWVVSDGYADRVSPQHPERWQFFLSCDYRGCIPAASKVWMLDQFE